MLSKIKYEVQKKDKRTNAKTVMFTNPILNKKHTFPSVMFDIRKKEDLDSATQTYAKGNQLDKVSGFQIPFYKLAKFMPILVRRVPRNMVFISDINSEVFYYGNIKEDKKDFYLSYKLIPEKIRNEIIAVQKKKGSGSKVKQHLSVWNNIVSNKKILLSLLSYYVNNQMSYQLDFISVPSPLILDKNHLVYVEECYNQAMRLYHGELLDIVGEPKRLRKPRPDEMSMKEKLISMFIYCFNGFSSRKCIADIEFRLFKGDEERDNNATKHAIKSAYRS